MCRCTRRKVYKSACKVVEELIVYFYWLVFIYKSVAILSLQALERVLLEEVS